jgi:hypothetical protein
MPELAATETLLPPAQVQWALERLDTDTEFAGKSEADKETLAVTALLTLVHEDLAKKQGA